MNTPKTPPKAPAITPDLLAWLESLYPVPRWEPNLGPTDLLVAAVRRGVVDRVRAEYDRQQTKEEK